VNSITLNERRFRFCDGMETKAAIGPECVKTLIASSSWVIDVRLLSDSTVNIAGRIGRDLGLLRPMPN
jgi:hypothetical protein